MGYYTIRLDPAASEMCTLNIPWGKYSYKRLPMCLSRCIPSQMLLMASLEFVQVYIDDLLIITRGALDYHLLKMETVLTRLRDTRLKVNTAKSLLCTQEIEYLGYILNREETKPQPKKVLAILTLNMCNNVKELRCFLGMMQYYREMWAKCSEMLAPQVGECSETKTIKKNKTKKKPWQWDSIH
jgi:hypothetical protein